MPFSSFCCLSPNTLVVVAATVRCLIGIAVLTAVILAVGILAVVVLAAVVLAIGILAIGILAVTVLAAIVLAITVLAAVVLCSVLASALGIGISAVIYIRAHVLRIHGLCHGFAS